MTASQPMPVVESLRVLAEHCAAEQIVVTNQGSARIWPKMRTRALDFHYNPSTMGGAIPLALGVALAQPRREVVVVSGDGSLLMNLGSLVTVVSAAATNLTVVLLDNGIYEVTGGQKTPATTAVDYCGLAKSAGFATALDFQQLERWQASAAEVLRQPGPRFLRLAVGPAPEEYLRFATPPMAEQLTRLCSALGVTRSPSAPR
jgi:thiamine pyrophosphate-dependent acetolactate synthase large subunit-like protein